MGFTQVRRLPEPKIVFTVVEQDHSATSDLGTSDEAKSVEKKQKQAAKKARKAQKR